MMKKLDKTSGQTKAIRQRHNITSTALDVLEEQTGVEQSAAFDEQDMKLYLEEV